MRFVRRLAPSPNLAGEPDGELCARYSVARDEAAFAELVRRHGGMVYGVCRRTLSSEADTEDAAQAVFLLLALRANRFAGQPTVGDWLHGVATRTALNARSKRARRYAVEAAAARPDAVCPPEADDAADAVDRAVRALPARLRQAVVLCELEGHPRAEAAARLGIKPGTLASRLAAARVKLRRRLGPLAPAILLAASASQLPARASVHFSQAALGTVPAAVSVLATEVLRVMTIAKLKTILATGLVATGLAASGVAVSRSVSADETPTQQKTVPEKPPGKAGEKPAQKPEEPKEAPPAKPDKKPAEPAVVYEMSSKSNSFDGATSESKTVTKHTRTSFVNAQRSDLFGRWKVTSATLDGKPLDLMAENVPVEFAFGRVRYDVYNQFESQTLTVSVRERTFARGMVTKTETFSTAINPYRTPMELTLITSEPGSAKLLPYIYENPTGNVLRLATFQAVGEADRPGGFTPTEQKRKAPSLLVYEMERTQDTVRPFSVDNSVELAR